MTEKLYYGDSFLKEFTATVLSCEESKTASPLPWTAPLSTPKGAVSPLTTACWAA